MKNKCDCGCDSHKDQLKLFPKGSYVQAVSQICVPPELGGTIEIGDVGKVSWHCNDGRACIHFETGGGHTFHYPDGYIRTADKDKIPAPPPRLVEDPVVAKKRKDEYDRWFERGTTATKDQYESMCVAMNTESNAFCGFADGYASRKKKTSRVKRKTVPA